MKFPSLMSIRESPVGSGSESPVGSGQRFAMMPWEVGIDPKLTHLDTRIYFVLAACRRGLKIKIGTRLIAQYACTSQRRVVESLKHICAAGHLVATPIKRGARAEYRLTAAKFGASPGVELSVELANPGAVSTERRDKTALHCQNCHRRVKMVGNAGWCRSCTGDADLAAKLESARRELGRGATPEQLAAHLKNARLAQRIRRILEKSERAA